MATDKKGNKVKFIRKGGRVIPIKAKGGGGGGDKPKRKAAPASKSRKSSSGKSTWGQKAWGTAGAIGGSILAVAGKSVLAKGLGTGIALAGASKYSSAKKRDKKRKK